MLALALAGCGSGSIGQGKLDRAAVLKPRAQVVEPVAGTGSALAGNLRPRVATIPSRDPPPSGPATVTRAPAKGAPTDAQVRAAYVRFQAAIKRYRLYALNFSRVLLNPDQLGPGGWSTSIASVETAYGHAVACGGILRPPELGVANKTLPCGTEVTFLYGNRAIRVPVIDRGPYVPGRMWDLSGATAEALHFPGLGTIRWRLG
jgi:rare lipoprotein A (peptidoglycan hydrolase)